MSIGKLYSSRLAFHGALHKEYARSHTEGFAGTLSLIKRTVKEIRCAKAAYKAMEVAHPA